MKIRQFCGLLGLIAICVGLWLIVSYTPESQVKTSDSYLIYLIAAVGLVWLLVSIISNFIMLTDGPIKLFSWLAILFFLAFVALNLINLYPPVAVKLNQRPTELFLGSIAFCLGAIGSSVYDVLST